MLAQDVRYALRQLVRSPGFAVAAVLTLGLGIGANTAIFSVVNGLLLRPPGGIGGFEDLVTIYTSDFSGPPYGSSSVPDIQEFAGAGALQGVTGYTVAPIVLSDATGTTPAELALGEFVTGAFFDVLQTPIPLGRGFTAEEIRPAAGADVVVLAHSFWQTHFGADAGIVGRVIRLGGWPFTVIGVADEKFTGLLPGVLPAFWAPVSAPGAASHASADERGNRGMFTIGRLAPGSSIEQARTQLRSIATGLHEQYPRSWTDINDAPRRVSVLPASETIVPPQLSGPVTGFAGLLMVIVFGVLLIGCVNVANLLLARASARRQEIAVRVAIGAGRRHLIRQLLTESMVLASAGAVLGIALAWACTRMLTTVDLPLPVDVRLDVVPDARVLAFAGLVTIAAGLMFGLAPALLAARQSVRSAMQRDAEGGHRPGLRSALAAGQITIAIVLLVAGGLLVRSLQSAQSIDPGFDADGLVFLNLAFDAGRRSDEQRVNIQRQLAERARALPGVAGVSYMSSLPLGAGQGRRSFNVEGYEPGASEDMEIHFSFGGPDLFRVMGTDIVRGRGFDETDGVGGPDVVVVNEAFVRKYLPGQDPIGKRLGGGGNDALRMEIIGVAKDGKYVTLGEEPTPFVWQSADQQSNGFLTLVVRAANRPGRLAQPLRALAAEIDPDAAVTDIVLAGEHLAFALLPQRAGAWLLGLFGLLGLGLAALGIYGVVAYAVAQRRREFGIRLALGARSRDVTSMVVRQGMKVAAIGGVLGLGLAAGTTRLMRFLLFDVAPLDPVTFACVTAIVAGIVWLANWLPARRTARVDPIEALRYD